MDIDIEGELVALDPLHGEQRWLAQGQWGEYIVQIHAVCIEPAHVHLRLAGDIPER